MGVVVIVVVVSSSSSFFILGLATFDRRISFFFYKDGQKAEMAFYRVNLMREKVGAVEWVDQPVMGQRQEFQRHCLPPPPPSRPCRRV